MPVTVATWNVNSLRQRIEGATQWLGERRPDIVCLQEIKCQDDAFPREPFEALGYNLAICGQKTFNGVAILSKRPFELALKRLPGDEADEQARYIEVVVPAGNSALRVASIYLPNGNPLGTDKFPYKLNWMARLKAHAAGLLTHEEPAILAGDYNVIPTPADCHDPKVWANDALFQPESRGALRAIEALGYRDALRLVSDAPGLYTFWDYQAGAFQKNWGIRIDHLLLSPQAADRLITAGIDKDVRAREKPSDHVPVYAEFAFD